MIGKGIESLIPKKDSSVSEEKVRKDFIFWIETEKIKPNPYQPRKEFNEEALHSLADSIKKYGMIQPIIVNKIEKKNEKGIVCEYQIVAGERRWRASKILGLKQIPAIIKEQTNKEKLEIALIENVQRKNLNPIDKAEAFDRLKREFGLLDKEIAKLSGLSREVVTNSLRILSLPEEVKGVLKSGVISEGHARALLGAKEAKLIKELLDEIISNGYSVRETERRVKERNAGAMAKKTEVKKPVDSGVDEFLERKVKQVLNLENIKIEKKKSSIRLSFDFNSIDEINQWLKNLRK
ncbi:MAG: ParB/RepB/Spo0J family partition protein [Candidatus Pacebacteria bacterium]|nr:ParB/RepB/Spo0J family partition protein [Candidatus Paceibacterota bacterium]MDD2757169.1 ParB/RepB/Spo0J family partition protein [Candidatus Paceibacterota bacterium]MDD3283659.1 ParB/RepB/Spo0J family partition protein [Candidatus Paceibacterota bacterium]MDD3969717.1 ParB/RepB/Spo0J family partition protein [Candidatus Paceibacterota bacterium]MDD4737687.1 ParB/RepB/Spo0J family partition protein [Candidatus Paceibacterota bacterium]